MNKILYLLLLCITGIFTSCDNTDEPEVVLVNSSLPRGENLSTEDGIAYMFNNEFRGNYGQCYFALDIKSYTIARAVFNCVTDSRVTAMQIAEALTSGKWLSETDPYPLDIERTGSVLHCDVNSLVGIQPTGQYFKYIKGSWYNHLYSYKGDLKLYYGTVKDNVYISDTIFGQPIKGTASATEKTEVNNLGVTEKINTYTFRFTAPSPAMAECLAQIITPFFSRSYIKFNTYTVTDKDVVITTRAIPSSLSVEEYLMSLDAFVHQPLQRILLQYGHINY